MTTRNYSATAQATTLTADATNAATTLSVAATTGFPSAPFLLCLDMGTASQEVVLVTAVAGLSLTVTRGYDSTTAISHSTGATATHTHSAVDFRDSRTHEAATTGVHGVTGSVVGSEQPLVYRLVQSGGVYPSRPANATYVEWVGTTQPTGAVSGDTYIATTS